MQLDRNINPDGMGKYALLKMRKVAAVQNGENSAAKQELQKALEVLHNLGILDYGQTEDSPGSDFMVIRLKDKYAAPALYAYAQAAREDDPQWAGEVQALARKARLLLFKRKARKPD
jgi:hypothetical protein